MKTSVIIISTILLFTYCKENTKKMKFNTPIKFQEVDTNDDKKIDSRGYYMDEEGNFRFIYTEVDNNLDGHSDLFVWVGSSPAPKKNATMKEVVKVHEEEDEDFDGKIDTIKWFLPNEIISMAQKDTNKDGYFETTVYYNFKKVLVRTEVDTNFDGRADVIYWSNRAEIDFDFDGIPDSFAIAPTRLILDDMIDKERELKPTDKKNLKVLNNKDSWFLNPSLIPVGEKAIIGSGYN